MDSNDLVTCSKTLMQALNEIDQVETHSLPAKFVSSSITDMLLVEQAAAILVPHGISMEVEGAFGAPSSPERFPSILHSSVGILYIVDERRLLELFLTGVILPLHPSDRKSLKEKHIWLSPTLTALCWQSRSSDNRLRSLPLSTVLVTPCPLGHILGCQVRNMERIALSGLICNRRDSTAHNRASLCSRSHKAAYFLHSISSLVSKTQ